jgi:hypothetical protein
MGLRKFFIKEKPDFYATLGFTTPERDIKVNAEVVWSNAYGRDDDITPRGMGVRFVKISEEDKKFLDEVVKEYDVGKIAAEYLDTLKTEISDN